MAQHARFPEDQDVEERDLSQREIASENSYGGGAPLASSAGSHMAPPPPKPQRRGAPWWVVVIVAIAALVGGGFVGRFLLTPTFTYVQGKTTLTESELDSVVGSYRNGSDYVEITAREAIESTSSLEAMAQGDGTYRMPSADNVLNTARNQILAQAVENEGITVSDEEMSAYAEQMLGSSDYAELSKSLNMSEDQVKAMVKEAAGAQKLYEQKNGGNAEGEATPEAPAVPEAPAEGQENEATPEYGAYIVGLLGSNWDSANNTWANTDNPYYTALQNESFSADSATYNQAMEAYYVAYTQYSEENGGAGSGGAWMDYINGLMANASITIGEMVS